MNECITESTLNRASIFPGITLKMFLKNNEKVRAGDCSEGKCLVCMCFYPLIKEYAFPQSHERDRTKKKNKKNLQAPEDQAGSIQIFENFIKLTKKKWQSQLR